MPPKSAMPTWLTDLFRRTRSRSAPLPVLERLAPRVNPTNLAFGLFDTAVDNAGALLPVGSVDPHYTIPINPENPGDPTAFSASFNDTFGGRAIAGHGDQSRGPYVVGDYTFRTTFRLPVGGAGLAISATIAVDDDLLDVVVNGTSTGRTQGFFHPQPLIVADSLVIGTNTLDFKVRNTGGPVGLNVWNFDVVYLTPTLTSVGPTSAIAGSPSATVTLTGSNFSPGSVAKLDGVDLATTFVSSTQLTAVVPASQLTSPRIGSIAATTAGGTTAPRAFRVTPPQVSFSVPSEDINAGTGSFSIAVRITGPVTTSVSVPYSLSGTAVSGVDYSGATAGTLTFAPGQTTATISGNLLLSDAGDRQLTFTFGDPSGAAFGSFIANTLRIVQPATSTALTSAGATVYGQSATFTASVTDGASPITFGTVTFRDGDTVLRAGVPLDADGRAAFSTTLLTASGSPHTITATYDGGTRYLSSRAGVAQTVTRAPLSVVVDGKTRVYGSANPTLTGTLTGVVDGDRIFAIYATTATSASDVVAGGYAIAATLSDTDQRLSNYTVTLNTGTLAVTTAPLKVVAADVSMVEDDPDPVFTALYVGLVGGDTSDSLGGRLSFLTVPVDNEGGLSTITPSGLTSGNYAISFVRGRLTVMARPTAVEVTAPAISAPTPATTVPVSSPTPIVSMLPKTTTTPVDAATEIVTPTTSTGATSGGTTLPTTATTFIPALQSGSRDASAPPLSASGNIGSLPILNAGIPDSTPSSSSAGSATGSAGTGGTDRSGGSSGSGGDSSAGSGGAGNGGGDSSAGSGVEVGAAALSVGGVGSGGSASGGSGSGNGGSNNVISSGGGNGSDYEPFEDVADAFLGVKLWDDVVRPVNPMSELTAEFSTPVIDPNEPEAEGQDESFSETMMMFLLCMAVSESALAATSVR